MKSKTQTAIEFAHQAERLSLLPHGQDDAATAATTAVQARFVTPRDPVIELANGGRLPAVPVEEAVELNRLRERLEDTTSNGATTAIDRVPQPRQQGNVERADQQGSEEALDGGTFDGRSPRQSANAEASLRTSVPSSRTNPLFPPLPLYGPPSLLRNLQCTGFRAFSCPWRFWESSCLDQRSRAFP
jgi:transposase